MVVVAGNDGGGDDDDGDGLGSRTMAEAAIKESSRVESRVFYLGFLFTERSEIF